MTLKIFICNPYFYDLPPSPLMLYVQEILQTKYGVENVKCDNGNISLAEIEQGDKFVIICDEYTSKIHNKIYLTEETIMSHLPSDLKYRESIAGKLFNWLREIGLIDPLGLINWEEINLDEALNKVDTGKLYPIMEKYRNMVKDPIRESYENRHYNTQLSTDKYHFIFLQIKLNYYVIAENMIHKKIPIHARLSTYSQVETEADWPNSVQELIEKFLDK